MLSKSEAIPGPVAAMLAKQRADWSGRLFTVNEACALRKVSRSNGYRKLAAGEWVAVKDGARLFIVGDSLADDAETMPVAVFRAPKVA
jgi:hypothetical protein